MSPFKSAWSVSSCALVLCLLLVLGAHAQPNAEIAGLNGLLSAYPVLSSYGWSNTSVTTACTNGLYGVTCASGVVVGLYALFRLIPDPLLALVLLRSFFNLFRTDTHAPQPLLPQQPVER